MILPAKRANNNITLVDHTSAPLFTQTDAKNLRENSTQFPEGIRATGTVRPNGGERELSEIRTARLVLEPLTVGHAAELAGVLDDPALHTFIGGEPENVDQLRVRYARWAAGSPDPDVRWGNWAVRLVSADRVVGTVQATIQGDSAEVAWVVGTGWQGRGIATEAARGLLDWLLEEGMRTIVAHVHPGNVASARVALALGLRPTGREQDGEAEWALTVSS